MKDRAQFHFNYWMIAILVFLGLQYLLSAQQEVATIPYSEFEQHLKEGRIEELAITDRRIEGRLKEPLAGGQRRFITNRVEPQLAEHLQQYPVRYTGKVESTLVRDLLSWIIPAAMFFGIWLFLLKRIGSGLGGGGMMQIGKSKARVYVETDMKVSFADVAGVDEAKDELKEIIEFLRDPQTYGRLGGRMPKGVLLVGPPGTGKTLLARAVAGEGAILLHFRFRVRRAVRRCRCGAGARSVRAGAGAGTGDHLHRRTGRPRSRPRCRPPVRRA